MIERVEITFSKTVLVEKVDKYFLSLINPMLITDLNDYSKPLFKEPIPAKNHLLMLRDEMILIRHHGVQKQFPFEKQSKSVNARVIILKRLQNKPFHKDTVASYENHHPENLTFIFRYNSPISAITNCHYFNFNGDGCIVIDSGTIESHYLDLKAQTNMILKRLEIVTAKSQNRTKLLRENYFKKSATFDFSIRLKTTTNFDKQDTIWGRQPQKRTLEKREALKNAIASIYVNTSKLLKK